MEKMKNVPVPAEVDANKDIAPEAVDDLKAKLEDKLKKVQLPQ